MKNGIQDLNNYLFEQLERLQDDLTDEELEKELKRASGVSNIATKILETETLAFKVMQHQDEYGYNRTTDVPKMLEVGKCQENTHKKLRN